MVMSGRRSRWNPSPSGAGRREVGPDANHESYRRDLDRRGNSKHDRPGTDDGNKRYCPRGEGYGSNRSRGYQVHRKEVTKWTVSAEDRWFCEECKRENVDLGGNHCSFCGTPRSQFEVDARSRRPREFPEKERSRSSGPNRQGQHRSSHSRIMGEQHSRRWDEGRRRDARSDREKPLRESRKGDKDEDDGGKISLSKEWPPAFESSGASYVFDARSGYFYEPMSDFFFDPKTKFYYGNKKKAYFQHCPKEDPPFRPVSQSAQMTSVNASMVPGTTTVDSTIGISSPAPQSTSVPLQPSSSGAEASSVGGNGGKVEKKKIAISIGKISNPKSSCAVATSKSTPNVVEAGLIEKRKQENSDPGIVAGAEVKTSAGTGTIQKRHAADIGKWSERGKEGTVGRPLNVTTTAEGKPICALCKRKFSSLEKLREHEEKSTLHKQNLLKANSVGDSGSQKDALTPDAVTVEYRDRAKERRFMFGSERKRKAVSEDEKGLQLKSARSSGATVKTISDEALGDTNVGNQLLQKMGWKKGGSLGRKADDEGASGSAVDIQLKGDWEKIEGLAGGDGVGSGSFGRCGGVGA